MKIAISSTGLDPNAQVDLHFGRCQYFFLMDREEKHLNTGLTKIWEGNTKGVFYEYYRD